MTDGVKVAVIMSVASILAPLWGPWLQRTFSRVDKREEGNASLLQTLLGMVETGRRETREDLAGLRVRVDELEADVTVKDKLIERLQEDVTRLEGENRQLRQKCQGLEELVRNGH